jgi:CBS domain-containing protein
LAQLVRISESDRERLHLRDCARPLTEIPTAQPSEDLAALVQRVGADLDRRVLVFDGGALVGIVSPVDLARVVTLRQTSAGAANR